MDLQFYGANVLTITTKEARVTIDDNLLELGGKGVIRDGDVVLYTQQEHSKPKAKTTLIVDGPGEYEVNDVNILALAMRAHTDEEKEHTATLYKIEAEDLSVVVTGHIFPEVSNSQIELLGTVDVLCIPVGNRGYTLDGVAALELIKRIEPKMVIPTHYADDVLKYPVAQQTLEEALKSLAMEVKETVSKLKVKANDLSDITELVILEKQ